MDRSRSERPAGAIGRQHLVVERGARIPQDLGAGRQEAAGYRGRASTKQPRFIMRLGGGVNGQFKDSYEEYRVQPYFSRAVLVSARASSSTCAATPCSNAVRRRPHPPFGEQRKERGKRFLRVCGEGVRLARLPGSLIW